MPPNPFPWYEAVTGDELEQGDLLDACPVFRPPDELSEWDETAPVFFETEGRNVIVVSQACDLVKGREKLSEVLLCPVWNLSSFRAGDHLSTVKGREEARRGMLPNLHMLAGCSLPGLERDIRIVDFRQVFSLPVAFTRQQAERSDSRLRLLPPYREHLAQAFARFFMRIGLPLDIPPFR